MSDLRLRKVLVHWPYLVLGVLVVVFALMLVFSRKAPVIHSLEPPMAAPGEEVTVNGEYFGRTEREGSLSFAGEIPPPSLIKSWSDQKIVFVVPDDASSGLVSVSNSQGTSAGMLLANTVSIPTVLQTAGVPGKPLLWSVLPASVVAGQTVTLMGRGFGTGSDGAVVVNTGGPVLEIGPQDCLGWSDRSVTFRVPAGAQAGATVAVRTSTGVSPALDLAATSSLVFAKPRTLAVEFRAKVTVWSSQAVTVWGLVPQPLSGTQWTLDSASPTPLAHSQPLAFSFVPGASGDREVLYKLTLTTWERDWLGLASGQAPAGDAPAGDPAPWTFWKASAPALKVLTAKWGLETPDPWLRLQRLQTGLAASWSDLTRGVFKGQPRTPAQILGSKQADSVEISTLAVALATQAGLPARRVTGLWQNDAHALVPRSWVEVWIPAAGWIPWDVIDGNPGSLDNRHFAFEVGSGAPERLLPRSRVFFPLSPVSLTIPTGEAAGGEGDPVAQWQITSLEK
jgi:hypothetical protein